MPLFPAAVLRFLPRTARKPRLSLAGLLTMALGLGWPSLNAAPTLQEPPAPAAEIQPQTAPVVTPQPRARVAQARRVVKPAATVASEPPARFTASGRPVSAEDIESFTDTLIPALMQRDHVLGVTVAVVQGDTPLLVKGYGYDRLSPRRSVDGNSTLFRIGSITKTFTWLVARQEIEAGRLTLDKPIDDVLPDDIYREDRRYKPLRLRDLMAHTGGFEDSTLGHMFRLEASRIESTDTYFRRNAPARVRDRGEYATYSNYGAALASRVVANSAKARDVPSLMEARIFTPLGLNHTTLREPYDPVLLNPNAAAEGLPAPMSGNLSAKLSQGFAWDGATYVAKPFDFALPMAGALSASSTSADMGRYMSLLLGNGQLKGTQLFDAGSAAAFRSPLLKMPNGYNGWASGLRMGETPQGLKTFGHGGSTLWFNANMILVPDLGIGIFIAANTQTGDALTRSYPDLLIRHLEGGTGTGPNLPTEAQAYARNPAYYASLRGAYVSSRRAFGGLEGAVTRLINTVDADVDAQGRLIIAAQDGISTFVPASASGYFLPQEFNPQGPQIGSEGLHFLFKPTGGKATAFETSANMARFERVSWFHKPQTLHDLTALMMVTCVLVLMGLGRYAGRDHPTEAQVVATWVSYALASIWILSVCIFQGWASSVVHDPAALFTNWPSGQLKLASTMAVIAALGTLYQLFMLYRVYEDAHYHADGWALWQKIMHSLLNIGWLLYAILLMSWGALQPWS